MFTEDAFLQMARDRRASYLQQAHVHRMMSQIPRDRRPKAATTWIALLRRPGRARHARPAACAA